ncbi:MAG: hypothetical protein ACE5E6_10475 [Phycisphaerae bacterium]
MWIRLGLVVVLVCAVAGCGTRGPSIYRSSTRVSPAFRSPDSDGPWRAIQDALRAHGFRLDRVDRRAGIVTTMPETSMHFFEFWRHDVHTRHDLIEATLNPMRRWAEVSVLPEPDGEGARLAVVVHKQRFSGPDRQFNSTGAAYQYFGYSLPSTTGAARVRPADERWIDVGRDPATEDYLLSEILALARREAVAGADAPAP